MSADINRQKEELIAELKKTVTDLSDLFSTIDAEQINTVPYEGSWTAGELLRHVAKSTRGLHEMLSKQTKSVTRDPGARMQELKDIFLNFDSKMQSPDFIIPEKRVYEKQFSLEQFNKNFTTIEEDIQQTDFTQVVEGLPFGEITKLEMLYFLVYHMQRHIHQLHKIADGLEQQQEA